MSKYIFREGVYTAMDPIRPFNYSDGDETENYLLDLIGHASDLATGSEELLAGVKDWRGLYHLSPKRVNLLRPLAGELRGKAVLEIGSGCGALTRYLGELGCAVTALEGSERRARITAARCRDLDNVRVVSDVLESFDCEEGFDFITLVGVLEYSNLLVSGEVSPDVSGEVPPLEMLKRVKKYLRPGGRLILAIENKLGLKYWSGAPEDHAGKAFFGIEDQYGPSTVVSFGKKELGDLLINAGLLEAEFLYPFPDYKLPDVILKEKAFQTENFEVLNLLHENFDSVDENVYNPVFSPTLAARSLHKNQLLPDFANSFLVVAGLSGPVGATDSKILAFTYNSSRKRRYCKENIFRLRKGGTIEVQKRDLYPGEPGLYHGENGLYSGENGLYSGKDPEEVSQQIGQPASHLVTNEKYMDGRLLSGEVVPVLAREGWTIDEVAAWARQYFEILHDHSEWGSDVGKGYVAEKGNDALGGSGFIDGRWLDLTPFNILIDPENKAVVFDQEWTVPEKIPVYFIFFRGLVYSLAKISFIAPPAEGTPLNLVSLVMAVINTLFPFGEEQLADCVRLEEKYFSPVMPSPGRAFSHGNLKISASADRLAGRLARTEELIIRKDELLMQQQELFLQKEGELERNKGILSRAETALSASENELLRKNTRLVELEDEMRLDEERRMEIIGRLQEEAGQWRELADSGRARQEALEKELGWYKRTYEDRSFQGVIKEKLQRAIRRRYRNSIDRLLQSGRLRSRHVLTFLLRTVRDQGLRKFLSLYRLAARTHGISRWLHPRKILLLLMQQKPHSEWALPTGHPEEAPDLEKLKADVQTFDWLPTLSFILPVYNTKPALLEKAIRSIQDQIYPHWELCIADDHSTDKGTIDLLNHYSSDPRIKISFLPQNTGISEASNAAIRLATGEYIALVDHDDEITPDALYWCVRELNEQGEADIIYSDECKVDEKGVLSDFFLKPDWSPELLLNCMFTGHLSLYRKDFLLQLAGVSSEEWAGVSSEEQAGISSEGQAGVFRKEYDFSQDYDLMLRASEQTTRIRHIPRVLYHWRMTEGSAAQGEKPYARQSNLAALDAAMKRRGIEADIIALPTANRARIKFAPVKVSIIIPTDSYDNLRVSLQKIADTTVYPDYEIVVVTNTGLIDRMRPEFPQLTNLVFSPYDLPYNFSDKCNQGARYSKGDILLFFNDDVHPLQKDWIGNTIEFLFVPGVGAVSPKLIYEDDTLQYAGMATGVRNLTGTTFHCCPKDSVAYFQFPQLVRNVSVLSGACLAMKKAIFEEIGGFDSIHTPSAHSDVDLSFRVRELGLRCVYTPYASLRHIGHLSLADHEKRQKKTVKDKADIFLLRRWMKYLSADPYFTHAMRNYLYRDSPEPFRLYAPAEPFVPGDKGDLLVIAHELSLSGAPIVLLEACRLYVKNGYFVVVICDKEGPLVEKFLESGIPVIIDTLVLRQHPSLVSFARNFDRVIANTIVTWPVVRQLQDVVKTLWWLHEARVLESFVLNPDCLATLGSAKNVIGVSDYSLEYIKKYNPRPQKLRLGYDDIRRDIALSSPAARQEKLVFSVIGSLEPRKGQDILIDALGHLPRELQDNIEIWLIGRTLDLSFREELVRKIGGSATIRLLGEKSRQECLDLIDRSDVVISPSRDDPFPVVLIEALCFSKPCIISTHTGLCELIRDGENGFVFSNGDSRELAGKLIGCLQNRELLEEIGRQGRKTFEEYLTMEGYEKNLLDLLSDDAAPHGSADDMSGGSAHDRSHGSMPVNGSFPHFIDSDEFTGVENICRRERIAGYYLRGEGIEIGALHKPLAVPGQATVRYVDYKSREENKARYPELVAAGEAIVPTDIIDDGFLLKSLPEGSQDFVIANHALEHSPDPLGTLQIWLGKLRASGILYVTVPIADKCYDKGRPLTSLQHLQEDHRYFKELDKTAVLEGARNHIHEFISISGRNIARLNHSVLSAAHDRELEDRLVMGLDGKIKEAQSYEELVNAHVTQINRVYDIHYHTFSPSSYEAFLGDVCRGAGATLENVLKNGSGECIGIIRKN